MGVHLPHLYGKILIVVLGPPGCLLDGLSCSQKKYWWVGWFWALFGRLWGGQKREKPISPEPLMIRTWLNPHFNHMVTRPSEVTQNSVFLFFFLEKSLNFENIVTRQALVILILMITLVTRIYFLLVLHVRWVHQTYGNI